ncbi:hypothetical protein HCN51_55100 [Nonomuraea sp. FMUSA5-5]|uniref:Uncharacterized protein n=1 Tax=Nonomuraea composti TaxID=2720023 RepID=A0ABX1BUR4_9ACTN|nr:hypothetical protein [Nonomuraea sp. FMUSA5-5]NJP98458.1 hypothetical protein [Nonomuraea sp. FMUSA5-5]
MSTPTSDEELPILSPEVEQQALMAFAAAYLQPLSLEQLHEAVDRLAGPGAAQAAIMQCRRRAAESARCWQELLDEAAQRDPEGAAAAQERARRILNKLGIRAGSAGAQSICIDPPLPGDVEDRSRSWRQPM